MRVTDEQVNDYLKAAWHEAPRHKAFIRELAETVQFHLGILQDELRYVREWDAHSRKNCEEIAAEESKS
jgi:hypothetical protein